MKSHIKFLIAALAVTPLVACAPNQPREEVSVTATKDQLAVKDAVEIQGRVKSIDRKTRTVVIKGANGNTLSIEAGKDVVNFKQIRLGDYVTLRYYQAAALNLKKVDNNGVRKRVEYVTTSRAAPGEKPSAKVTDNVEVIATVVAIDTKSNTVTIEGVKRRIQLVVKDPALLQSLKVGDQVQATYTESVAVSVTPYKPR
jgi:Cu/Ag efflux protein CusF